jgi:hypothetical protein
VRSPWFSSDFAVDKQLEALGKTEEGTCLHVFAWRRGILVKIRRLWCRMKSTFQKKLDDGR